MNMRTGVPLIAVLLAGCGSATTARVQPSAQPPASDQPTAAQVAQWPRKWCNEVFPGVDRADLRATMGIPTEIFNDSDKWDAFGYQFLAFYDETGHASQVDWNPVGLSASQRAKITCDDSRTT